MPKPKDKKEPVIIYSVIQKDNGKTTITKHTDQDKAVYYARWLKDMGIDVRLTKSKV